MKKIQLFQTGKTLCFIMAYLFSTAIVSAQVSKTVNVATAGTLSSLLTDEEKSTVTDLTVTGNINKDDFNTMKFLNGDNVAAAASILTSLDLSNATVDGDIIPALFSYPYFPVNLVSLKMPSSIKGLTEYSCYQMTSLKSIDLSNCTKLEILPKSVFTKCSALDSVVLPPNLTEISNGAFSYTALKNMEIPSSVTYSTYQDMGSTFSECQKMETFHLTLTNNPISELPYYMFRKLGLSNGSNAVTFIIDIPTPPELNGTFLKSNSTFVPNSTLYVPLHSVAAYQATADALGTGSYGWMDFKSIIGRPMVKYSVDGVACDSLYVFADSLLTAPADPVKEGYTFDGWYSDAASTTAWDFATAKATTDTTLYARFSNENTTGLNAHQSENKLSVCPNPVNDILTVTGLDDKAMLTLTDLSGKTVISCEVNNGATIRVSSLNKGLYIARIGSQTFKMVKE
ncbi:MAG: leucine-rich repeat protein [Paludibacter sp.]|nr:leucine-rich repeat protein [Paludibacter sp.]